MKLGGSVGYQSYSQDKSAYFPTNWSGSRPWRRR